VLPKHKRVTVDFDVKERIVHPDGISITGEGRLWVDGKKIYQFDKFGTRLRFSAITAETPTLSRPTNEQLRTMDMGSLRQAFKARLGSRGPVLQDLFLGLLQQFVAGLNIESPVEYAALTDRPVLYLANHQVAVESMLFVALVDALNAVPCRAIAKDEHRDSWMGRILRVVRDQIGRDSIVLFDRNNPSALLSLLNGLVSSDGRLANSLLVHVQGTRSLRAGEPTTQVSSALIDFAIRYDLPIVPVKFTGGLPREAFSQRLEFPYGYGRQTYSVGPALFASDLQPLNLLERKTRVIEAINQTGAAVHDDEPAPANEAIASKIADLQDKAKLSLISAALVASLEAVPGRSSETDQLLANLRRRPAVTVDGEDAQLLDALGIVRDNRRGREEFERADQARD
jgi:1-acyl-sn-glycerol-3-phosphate acyltransferase